MKQIKKESNNSKKKSDKNELDKSKFDAMLEKLLKTPSESRKEKDK